MRGAWLLPVSVAVLAGSAVAQTPACDALSPAHRATAKDLFARLHPYDCCDDTLTACLEARDRCRLAVRLADDVCRLAKLGKGRAEIERAMSTRALSMILVGPKAAFALDEATMAGDPKAPVEVVAYVCTRCPFCKSLLPALYREVAEGGLKGKARLYVRPFPLKGHAGSTEGALGLVAAARLGRFWPFVLHVYANFDKFEPSVLPAWAHAVGIDQAAFKAATEEEKTREAVVEGKKEGLRNKVASTPALFINGRSYSYEMELSVLADVLTEEHERNAEAKRPPSTP